MKNRIVRVGCGALIINDKGEVLLLKRGKKTRNQAGLWCQPGGGVDYGETVEQAIIREIKEELGIEIQLVKYLCYTDQILSDEDQHWIAISYLGKIVKGEAQNLEPHKHEEIAWFSINSLPDDLSDTTKDSTKAYLVSGL